MNYSTTLRLCQAGKHKSPPPANGSLDDPDPALGGLDAAHLDAGEGVVELPDGGAHSGVVDLPAVIHDGAQGGDNRGGAAQAGLLKIADLAEGDGTLLHLHAQVLLGDVQQGTAGDGGQNGVRQGGDQGVALDENHVGSAGFLDMGAGGGIQIDVLVIALLVGVHNVVQAHGIVQSRLYMAGAPGRGTVQIGDADGQGLDAALEVGAYGGGKDAELVFRGGLDADGGVGTEHKGPDVQRGPGAEGGHPGGVGADGLHHGVHKTILGEYGHSQTAAGIGHPGGVQVGTEADDASILGGVGLHTLKAGLGILQYTGALIHGDGGVLRQAAIVPRAVFVVGHKALVRLDIAKAQAAPVNILLFHNRHLLCSWSGSESILFPFWPDRPTRTILRSRLWFPILSPPVSMVNRKTGKMFPPGTQLSSWNKRSAFRNALSGFPGSLNNWCLSLCLQISCHCETSVRTGLAMTVLTNVQTQICQSAEYNR